jgi:hypothetical protein
MLSARRVHGPLALHCRLGNWIVTLPLTGSLLNRTGEKGPAAARCASTASACACTRATRPRRSGGYRRRRSHRTAAPCTSRIVPRSPGRARRCRCGPGGPGPGCCRTRRTWRHQPLVARSSSPTGWYPITSRPDLYSSGRFPFARDRTRVNLSPRSAPSNLIGANGFAVGERSLGWRLRHPEGTRPQGAP